MAINFGPIVFKSWKRTLKRTDYKMAIGAVLTIVIFINALTHKPHNIFLNALLLFTSCKLNATINTLFNKAQCSDIYRLFIQCVVHFWLGKCFFFYQGNSNNLATVDLNAGYIGLNHFHFIPVMFFITINTYNGPILTVLLLIYNELDATENMAHTVKQVDDQCVQKKANIPEIILVLSILIALPFVFYCIVVDMFGNHIFVWTVFSPKLIYEAFHLVLMNFIYICTLIVLGKVN